MDTFDRWRRPSLTRQCLRVQVFWAVVLATGARRRSSDGDRWEAGGRGRDSGLYDARPAGGTATSVWHWTATRRSTASRDAQCRRRWWTGGVSRARQSRACRSTSTTSRRRRRRHRRRRRWCRHQPRRTGSRQNRTDAALLMTTETSIYTAPRVPVIIWVRALIFWTAGLFSNHYLCLGLLSPYLKSIYTFHLHKMTTCSLWRQPLTRDFAVPHYLHQIVTTEQGRVNHELNLPGQLAQWLSRPSYPVTHKSLSYYLLFPVDSSVENFLVKFLMCPFQESWTAFIGHTLTDATNWARRQ